MRLMADLQAALNRATAFTVQHQAREGQWESVPDPRILENALIVRAPSAAEPTKETVYAIHRGRLWLDTARPQEHHPVTNVIDAWLKGLALGHPTPLQLGASF